jgi:hypothetical protein
MMRRIPFRIPKLKNIRDPKLPKPMQVLYHQADHGASLAICEPTKRAMTLALIGPLNPDDEPNCHTAERKPSDVIDAVKMAFARRMYAFIVSQAVNEKGETRNVLAKELMDEIDSATREWQQTDMANRIEHEKKKQA